MIEDHIKQLVISKPGSHKGQNGKLLIIGGSDLFHAPLLWAAEVASRVVDMVHVTSPCEVNERLMREKLQQNFWEGIVVPWSRVNEYIEEDDCILIGPGMPRNEGLEKGERPTGEIVNELLALYAYKRWVVDGGGLQTVDERLLNGRMIITPHGREWERFQANQTTFSKAHDDVVVLLKGEADTVVQGDKKVVIEGGNQGMTRGGTGDVLAGMVAALATKNDLLTAAVVASRANKLAGDYLYERVGEFYNASDLVKEIPQVLQRLIRG